jgi:hypothetical protein
MFLQVDDAGLHVLVKDKKGQVCGMVWYGWYQRQHQMCLHGVASQSILTLAMTQSADTTCTSQAKSIIMHMLVLCHA